MRKLDASYKLLKWIFKMKEYVTVLPKNDFCPLYFHTVFLFYCHLNRVLAMGQISNLLTLLVLQPLSRDIHWNNNAEFLAEMFIVKGEQDDVLRVMWCGNDLMINRLIWFKLLSVWIAQGRTVSNVALSHGLKFIASRFSACRVKNFRFNFMPVRNKTW